MRQQQQLKAAAQKQQMQHVQQIGARAQCQQQRTQGCQWVEQRLEPRRDVAQRQKQRQAAEVRHPRTKGRRLRDGRTACGPSLRGSPPTSPSFLWAPRSLPRLTTCKRGWAARPACLLRLLSCMSTCMRKGRRHSRLYSCLPLLPGSLYGRRRQAPRVHRCACQPACFIAALVHCKVLCPRATCSFLDLQVRMSEAEAEQALARMCTLYETVSTGSAQQGLGGQGRT